MTEGDREAALLAHWEGEPVRIWAELWRVPHLEVYRRISSTNDRVRELAEEGRPTLTTVLAEEQTAGRGRSGRRWQAPPASSLLVSFLLRPPGGEAKGVTPLLLGLAVARAVEVVTGLEAGIKWPNDVLLEGRKTAGILCEAGRGGPDDVVAGVGVNVRQRREDFPPELRPTATSLEMALGEEVSRSRLCGALVARVREIFDPAPEAIEGELAEELARRDVLRDRTVALESGVRGRALGLGSDGGLLLETDEGERRIMAGTVRALDDGVS